MAATLEQQSKIINHDLMERIRNFGDGALAKVAIAATFASGTVATEMAVNPEPVTGASLEAGKGIHYFGESTSPVPTGPVASEPTQPTGEAPAQPETTAPTDPKKLKQNCVNVALAKPKIVNAEVLHVGKFDKEPTQSWFLSIKYAQSMPDYCQGLYSRGIKAKAQAFHDGRWVNEGAWHGVSVINATNHGNWEDIGNVKRAYFPVCKARIMLQASSSDLSKNTGKYWAPHPVIKSRTFSPIPVTKILPNKPKSC